MDSESPAPRPKLASSSRKSSTRDTAQTVESKKEEPHDLSEEDRKIVDALVNKACHIPGNTWWQDLYQYQVNNHPLLSLFLHHDLHPVSRKMRWVSFIGSITFGLAVTNFLWLRYLYGQDGDEAQVVTVSVHNSTSFNKNDLNKDALKDTHISVNEAMLKVWTLGGILNAIYDNTIWYLTACNCCLPGQPLECMNDYRWLGSYAVVFGVTAISALATVIVVLRATISTANQEVDVSSLQSGGINDDQISFGQVNSAASFQFLISFAVELALNLAFYNPVIGTIMFSGILVCFKPVPFLGGRPYEMKMLEKEESAANAKPPAPMNAA